MASNEETQYIYVVNWEHFQHYKDRRPVWIKNYLDLLDNDDYLDLPGRDRALLEGVWKLAATVGNGRVPASEVWLRARLRLRYVQLDRLIQAGWIEVRASKALATCTTTVHRVKKEEVKNPPTPQKGGFSKGDFRASPAVIGSSKSEGRRTAALTAYLTDRERWDSEIAMRQLEEDYPDLVAYVKAMVTQIDQKEAASEDVG